MLPLPQDDVVAEPEFPEWITVKTASQMLGVSVSTVYKRIRTGVLPAVNLGTDDDPLFRLDAADVRSYLDAARVSA